MINHRFKKFVATIIIFLMGWFFVLPKKSEAGYWGEPTEAEFIHEAWVIAREAFIQTMVANLKNQANKLITNKVRSLLSGNSDRGALFITNYEDFIFNSAQKEAQVYTSNLFKSFSQGASSVTRKSLNVAEGAILNELSSESKSTMDDHVSGGVDNIFNETKGGGNAALLALVSNPYNNSFGAYVAGSETVSNKIAKLERAKEAESVAGKGFVSKVNRETNLINLPGSVLGDMTSMSESLPMMIVANASTIPELAASMAAQIISQAIESGITNISSQVNNQIGEMRRSVRGGISDIQKSIYGGIKFTD